MHGGDHSVIRLLGGVGGRAYTDAGEYIEVQGSQSYAAVIQPYLTAQTGTIVVPPRLFQSTTCGVHMRDDNPCKQNCATWNESIQCYSASRLCPPVPPSRFDCAVDTTALLRLDMCL